jgi:hypothetical protein
MTEEEKKEEEKRLHFEMIEKWIKEFVEEHHEALVELAKK